MIFKDLFALICARCNRETKRSSKIPNSNILDDFTCKLGTKPKRSIHRHRIVEFTDYDGKTVRVITNLYTVTAETIASIYKARWGVELFFRWIKQNLIIENLLA